MQEVAALLNAAAGSVSINESVFAVVLTLMLTAGIGVVSWTVNLLWRTSSAVGRLEERLDDLERRMDHQEQ